jgi:hypothetical protein
MKRSGTVPALRLACSALAALMVSSGASAQPTVLQSAFGPATYDTIEQWFQLSWSTRPSASQTRQFLIDSGLDAMMSNGQMISDVATSAPSNWDPPLYNPFSYHSGFSGGLYSFGPAATPLQINIAALNAAVNANAANFDIVRLEILKKVGDNVTVVLLGEKANFQFQATDFGGGVSFLLLWTGIGFNPAAWYDAGAQYAMRITVGNAAACPADLNGDNVVDVFDLLALLAAWGPCASGCPADLDGNGAVDVFDLLALLGDWGPC